MQITIPFLKTRFPELDHLPIERRNAILQKCVEADSLRQIGRRYLLYTRLVGLGVPAMGLTTYLILSRLDIDSPIATWLLASLLAVVILGIPVCMLAYHLRSSMELHALLARELEQESAHGA